MTFDPTKEKALKNLQDKRDEEYLKHLGDMQDLLNDCEDLKSYYDVRIANINSERSLLRREINELYNFLIKFGDIGDKLSIFDYSFEDFINIPHFSMLNKKSKNISIRHVSFWDCYFYGINAIIKSFQNKNTLVNEKKNFEEEKLHWELEFSSLLRYKYFLEEAKEIADSYFKTIILVKDLIYYTIIPELEGVQTFLYAQAAKDVIISNEPITILSPAKISRFKNSKKYNNHYTFIKNAHDYYLLITEFFKNPILTNIISKFEESESNTDFTATLESAIDSLDSAMVNDKSGNIGRNSSLINSIDKEKESFMKEIEKIEKLNNQLIENTVFSKEK